MTDIGLSCFILNFAALFIIHDPIYGLPQNTFFPHGIDHYLEYIGKSVGQVLGYR